MPYTPNEACAGGLVEARVVDASDEARVMSDAAYSITYQTFNQAGRPPRNAPPHALKCIRRS